MKQHLLCAVALMGTAGAALAANVPPTAQFKSTVKGMSATVDASLSKDTDGTITSYAWDFGNGKTGTGKTATVTYAADGKYKVRLTVTDNGGASRSMNHFVTIAGGGTTDDEACRPEGLYTTPGTKPAYCKVYDKNGREAMGADKPRRIIGYYTGWRTGKDGTPAYLAHQIPWDKLTHVNFAFAHVGPDNKVSVGTETDPKNAATGMTWPGVAGAEMDPAFPYKGHFNLLSKFKKKYPTVKTLVSIGGWAETGGYFDDKGNRVASGGFYTMTTNSDNSPNTAGINTFADSAVAFIRKYGFNGVDIDYEYATTMNNAGNPDDFSISNGRRAGLVKSFALLMKTLREKLDAASQADKTHYMLTVAAPASGYMLRGMETYPVTQYLDYVNIMSYDLHGAWNQWTGPNAALYDDGKDGELTAWNVYGTEQYKHIGYLNTDWAYHYFRGAMPAGRINIGVPYYTRGWKNVSGGTNGLWGTAVFPDQSKCPPGTGSQGNSQSVQRCGDGAIGIDNLWHDLDAAGNEVASGSNPMWHAMNLALNKPGSYIGLYGLDPAKDPSDKMTGTYKRYYDNTLVAPWLWNDQKKVMLSTEDEQSIGVKAQYVADRGIGGVMFWELAGDYALDTKKGEYFMGSTLTSLLYTKLKTAAPYGNRLSNTTLPAETLDIGVTFEAFALGDNNYPIGPTLTVKNNTSAALAGGTEFSFDVPTSTPSGISDESGAGVKVITDGSNPSGNNIGGLKNDFHRVSFTIPSWQSIPAGGTLAIKLKYYQPMPMARNWKVTMGGKSYALKQDLRRPN